MRPRAQACQARMVRQLRRGLHIRKVCHVLHPRQVRHVRGARRVCQVRQSTWQHTYENMLALQPSLAKASAE